MVCAKVICTILLIRNSSILCRRFRKLHARITCRPRTKKKKATSIQIQPSAKFLKWQKLALVCSCLKFRKQGKYLTVKFTKTEIPPVVIWKFPYYDCMFYKRKKRRSCNRNDRIRKFPRTALLRNQTHYIWILSHCIRSTVNLKYQGPAEQAILEIFARMCVPEFKPCVKTSWQKIVQAYLPIVHEINKKICKTHDGPDIV